MPDRLVFGGGQPAFVDHGDAQVVKRGIAEGDNLPVSAAHPKTEAAALPGAACADERDLNLAVGKVCEGGEDAVAEDGHRKVQIVAALEGIGVAYADIPAPAVAGISVADRALVRVCADEAVVTAETVGRRVGTDERIVTAGKHTALGLHIEDVHVDAIVFQMHGFRTGVKEKDAGLHAVVVHRIQPKPAAADRPFSAVGGEVGKRFRVGKIILVEHAAFRRGGNRRAEDAQRRGGRARRITLRARVRENAEHVLQRDLAVAVRVGTQCGSRGRHGGGKAERDNKDKWENAM